MEIRKEKILNAFNFLVSNISCSLFQILVLISLGILQFFIWFICGRIIWAFSGGSQLASEVSLIISYITISCIYGMAWFVFWRVLFKDGIKWFYYRVAFSIIPLIAALLMFNPVPDPLAMITMPKEPIFSCLVTGIILLPIYSGSIYKLILQSNKNKVRNTIVLFIAMLLLGSLIFVSSWNMMHIIYKI